MDECQTLMVYRLPSMVMGSKGEALFVVCRKRQQRPAVARVLFYLVPQRVSYASRWVADEDARGDLQQPTGQQAA